MYEINCGEIWGGIRGTNIDVVTNGIEASLFSSASDGGKGGDIYYFSVCERNLLSRIAIADVMGHGTLVSDTSEWLYNSLRDKINIIDNSEVLSDLNKLAVNHGYKALTTATVTAFYRETKDLSFSYAGHHPILIRRIGENVWTCVELPKTEHAANLPLGVDTEYPYDQATISLQSGDLMFLYTDGLIEAPNPSGKFFTEAGVMAALELSNSDPKEMKNSVLGALNRHVNGDLDHDDVTFIAVRIR